MLSDDFKSTLMNFFGTVETALFEYNAEARPKVITPIQYKIMEYIFFHEGASISGLCHCTYMSLPNGSREVKKLSEQGFLLKKSDIVDKRKYGVYLTQTGKDLMIKAFEDMMVGFENAIGDLSKQEEKTLAKHMEAVIDALTGHGINE